MIETGCILGRASRTKETLPDFREWCRVIRHPRVFRGLTGCQRGPPDLGLLKLCRYTSSTFTPTEEKYHINENEFLAVVKGLKKFSYFLLPKFFFIKN